MEEWVESLPFADPLRVLRALFDRIGGINHAPIKPALRAELLELALQPYAQMVVRHASLNAHSSVSAFERYRDEANAARQVANRLALGYKLVLTEAIDRRSMFSGQKLPRLAAQRAVQCLSYVLMHAYHEYLPQVPNVWPELHELHQYACEQKFADAPSVVVADREELGASVEANYARIALLSACDPLRLAYGQIWPLFEWLGKAGPVLRVSSPSTVTLHAPMLVVSYDQTGKPRRAAEFVRGLPEGAYLINPVPVARLLVGLDAPDSAKLRTKIAKALEQPRRRVDNRAAIEGRVHVVTGLASVHHFAGGGSTKRQVNEDTIDIDDFDPEDTLPVSHMYTSDSWHLANSSQRGVCLTRDRRSVSTPMIGDLVGLQSAEQSGQWAIGIVRWLAIDKTGSHSLGIELLSSNARPVNLRAESSHHKPALVLASANAELIRVVVPRGAAAPNEPLHIQFDGHDVTLHAQNVVESSDTIECIDCTR